MNKPVIFKMTKGKKSSESDGDSSPSIPAEASINNNIPTSTTRPTSNKRKHTRQQVSTRRLRYLEDNPRSDNVDIDNNPNIVYKHTDENLDEEQIANDEAIANNLQAQAYESLEFANLLNITDQDAEIAQIMQNDEDELINQTQQRQSRDYDIAFNLQNNINMNMPEEKLQETNLKDPPTSSESGEIAQPPISRNNQELMDNDDDSVSSLSLRYNFNEEYALKIKEIKARNLKKTEKNRANEEKKDKNLKAKEKKPKRNKKENNPFKEKDKGEDSNKPNSSTQSEKDTSNESTLINPISATLKRKSCVSPPIGSPTKKSKNLQNKVISSTHNKEVRVPKYIPKHKEYFRIFKKSTKFISNLKKTTPSEIRILQKASSMRPRTKFIYKKKKKSFIPGNPISTPGSRFKSITDYMSPIRNETSKLHERTDSNIPINNDSDPSHSDLSDHDTKSLFAFKPNTLPPQIAYQEAMALIINYQMGSKLLSPKQYIISKLSYLHEDVVKILETQLNTNVSTSPVTRRQNIMYDLPAPINTQTNEGEVIVNSNNKRYDIDQFKISFKFPWDVITSSSEMMKKVFGDNFFMLFGRSTRITAHTRYANARLVNRKFSTGGIIDSSEAPINTDVIHLNKMDLLKTMPYVPLDFAGDECVICRTPVEISIPSSSVDAFITSLNTTDFHNVEKRNNWKKTHIILSHKSLVNNAPTLGSVIRAIMSIKAPYCSVVSNGLRQQITSIDNSDGEIKEGKYSITYV